MKALNIIAAVATLLIATGSTLPVVQANEVSLGDIKRTNLLRNDLSAAGREVIQVLVEFGPGEPHPRLQSRIGDYVLLTQGSSARLTPETKNMPIDAVIIGIVDQVHVDQGMVYSREK